MTDSQPSKTYSLPSNGTNSPTLSTHSSTAHPVFTHPRGCSSLLMSRGFSTSKPRRHAPTIENRRRTSSSCPPCPPLDNLVSRSSPCTALCVTLFFLTDIGESLRYRGFIKGGPRSNPRNGSPTCNLALSPLQRIWGGWNLALHLNVAGYTDPLLFLFQQKHLKRLFFF